jgi:DNA-binding LacI/PurR family transcriptional regulator
MAVTIEQIAEKVGVAKSTVSRALSGKTGDSFIGRRRARQIREAATELGFRPNSAARAVATGRFDAVALVLSTDTHRSGMPPGLLIGIHDALARAGYSLTLARLVDERLTDERFLPRILREWMCDGLLVDYNVAVPPRMRQLIDEHHLPAVWVNAKQPFDAVRPDDFRAGVEAAEHLLKLGHRDIAYFDLAWEKSLEVGTRHYSKEDRFAGYAQAMNHAGLAPGLIRDVEGVTLKNLLRYTTEVLSRPDRPSAVLAYGDPEFIERAAAALGLNVPADLSVMTFGVNPLCVDELRVTSMTVPDGEVGRQGVEMLLEKIRHPVRRLPARAIHCPLCGGYSTAPPRADEGGARHSGVQASGSGRRNSKWHNRGQQHMAGRPVSGDRETRGRRKSEPNECT